MAIETFIRGWEADNEVRTGFVKNSDESMWHFLSRQIADYIFLIGNKKMTEDEVYGQLNKLYA